MSKTLKTLFLVFLSVCVLSSVSIRLIGRQEVTGQKEYTKEGKPTKKEPFEEYPYHLRADLDIKKLALQPERAVVGKPSRIMITLQNMGEEKSKKSTLLLSANKEKIKAYLIPPLVAGESHKVTINWTPAAPGFVRLAAHVYCGRHLERSDHNNTRIKEFIIFGRDLDRAKVKVVKANITPTNPRPGQIARLDVLVKNLGNKSVKNFPVIVRIGKRKLKLLRVPRLGSGETTALTYQWRVKVGDDRVRINPFIPSYLRARSRAQKRNLIKANQNPHVHQTVIPIRSKIELPLPDLELSNLRVQLVSDIQGESAIKHVYSVSFQVTNISFFSLSGSFSTRVTVAGNQRLEGNQSKFFSTHGLEAGETVYFQWTFTSSHSLLRVIAKTDPRRSLKELDERNNGAVVSYSALGNYDKWKTIGPTNIKEVYFDVYPETEAVGRLHRLTFDCENRYIMYVSATRCGIWRTRDGGISWEPISDYLPTMGFLGLAADPFQSGVVYAIGLESGGHGGVFKSEDYGDSWKLINEDFNGHASYTHLLPNDKRPNEFWATDNAGLWKSVDACQTWEQVFPEPGSPTTGTPLDIAISFDQESELPGIVMVVEPEDPTNNKQATIARSKNDNGRLGWDFITERLPDNFYSGRITLHYANPQIMYAAFKDTTSGNPYKIHVFKSIDHGDSWQEKCVYEGSNEYVGAIRTDPENPDTVFVGGINIHRSTNGGDSFDPIRQVHVDQQYIVFHPDNFDIVYILNDGGIYRSTDRGLNWEAWNHHLPNVEFHEIGISAINSNFVAGGTQDNGNIITYGDPEWWMLRGGDGTTTFINPRTDLEVYTTDIGVDSFYRYYAEIIWTIVPFPALLLTGEWLSEYAGEDLKGKGYDFPPSIVINPVNTSELAACAEELHRTVDKGKNWDIVLEPGNYGNMIRTCYDSSGNLYVVSLEGYVLVSDGESGNSFREISSGNLPWGLPEDIYVCSAKRVFVCYNSTYSDNKVWMLEPDIDGNYQARDITGNLLEEVKATAVLPSPCDSNIVYLGTYNGVKKGTKQSDGSWVWEDFNFGLPLAPVVDLEVNVLEKVMLVGTTGRGAFITKIR